MFDTQYSIINWLLHATHMLKPFDMPNWLGDPTLAIMSIIAVNVWRGFPFGAIILLAGMTSIPQEILDAAKVDGAGPVTRFRKVIVPMIAPVLFVGSLYDLVFTLTDMTVVYLLTLGGPANSTHVLSSYAFLVGVQSGALGRGAAIAILHRPDRARARAVRVLPVATRQGRHDHRGDHHHDRSTADPLAVGVHDHLTSGRVLLTGATGYVGRPRC